MVVVNRPGPGQPLKPAAAGHLSVLYGAALLLAALLLFWIQPLYTRMALPFFGGAPAVWTTASMFFQLALLAGYLYAHFMSQMLNFRWQVAVHLALLALVFFVLPVTIGEDAGSAAVQEPVTALLRLLALGLGLPFFAIAATAPLLQRWFSHTRHAGATDPYFLYVASNVGSMIALAGYPLVIEPTLGLVQQSLTWTGGYALLVLMMSACAVYGWRHRDAARVAETAAAGAAGNMQWRERALWALLAFAPSSLMLGVTQHITSEIAAVPLLWLVPLLLYVVTFVNAFATRPPIKLEWAARLQPWLVILLVLVWVLNIYLSVFVLHLVTFFVTALMCHGELARRRPHAAHLTEFYIWIALGGALGGAFNALAAPLLFDSVLEYPLVIALACMLRPGSSPGTGGVRWTDIALPAALGAGLAALVYFGIQPLQQGKVLVVLYLEVLGVALYFMHARPVRFGLAVAAALLAMPHLHAVDEVLARHRSFFGVHTVLKDGKEGFHVLMNGITVHGAQHLDPARRLEPTTFYHRDGPLGQMFAALGDGGRFRRIAMIGLGTGSAACYREPGREWTFFEVDPLVVQLARDTRWFTFLAECAPDAKVVTGDGRLSLKSVADGSLDLIIVDTFSSDAIPVHMMTREAIVLYFQKLAQRGVLMLHITNQYLDLAPVLANIASGANLAAMNPGPRLSLALDERYSQLESHWMALAREPADLAALETQEGWQKPGAATGGRPWTDDYSNILQALK